MQILIETQRSAGMANKGPSYGMSRQVQEKIDSKYDPELEQILVEWICRQCGSGVGRPEPGKMGFQAWLKDGCILGELINSLFAGEKPVKKTQSSPMAFKQMEQISQFLNAAEKKGLGAVACEAFNPHVLVQERIWLRCRGPCRPWAAWPSPRTKALTTETPTGSSSEFSDTKRANRRNRRRTLSKCHCRKAQENKRDFSDDQLKAGKNVIGLQMGSNKGASQEGMSYGRPRQIL
uniref:Transgelin n=1 Tax=Oryzias latipes TaxID=8090 RepID=H2MLU1_ORYLA